MRQRWLVKIYTLPKQIPGYAPASVLSKFSHKNNFSRVSPPAWCHPRAVRPQSYATVEKHGCARIATETPQWRRMAFITLGKDKLPAADPTLWLLNLFSRVCRSAVQSNAILAACLFCALFYNQVFRYYTRQITIEKMKTITNNRRQAESKKLDIKHFDLITYRRVHCRYTASANNVNKSALF